MRIRRVAAVLAATALTLTACEGDSGPQPESQAEESQRQQNSYNAQTEAEPAQEMDHPMNRITVNGWIRTWDEPGKLAYVYLQSANGDLIGYYVFEGLPVSYCASLTPTYRFENRDGGQYDADMIVPAPAMDGLYYFGGGSCETYYGFDATTGAYIEYTAGLGINVLLYDQPLPRQDVQPLGQTTIEDVSTDE